jgi:hypothetical protein
MIKRLLLGLVALLVLVVLWLHALGSGWLGGGPWQSQPVQQGPRPVDAVAEGTPQILFGDLHTHTNYSIDAYLFNTRLMKDIGVVTPADACDFARYCAALDFWSINDHAEGLTPRVWRDTVDSIRQCNNRSGDPASPDMVSFVGWEWSNGARDDVPSHYGHKNVIFRTWETGQTPSRPIASRDTYPLAKAPAVLLGLLGLVEKFDVVSDLGWYIRESMGIEACSDGVSSRELPDTCREVAKTPTDLYRKLDEWGYDSMVIPHGLAWGTTNPLEADFRNQLDEYEQRYEVLLETYSGHGNSERFEDFERTARDTSGTSVCPAATENFTPCCRRAGELARQHCATAGEGDCEQAAQQAMLDYAAAGARPGRKLFPDATPDDWAGCGQLQNSFQPASMYVPRQSTQYALALGFDEGGQAKRVRPGLIGSSDNHLARPGNSYKETSRRLYTDHKQFSGEPTWSYTADKESGSFYYTGGLVAVHSTGRDRDAIWNALAARRVYATSGDRMLVWFDLLNAPYGEAPMGSEVVMEKAPRFRVRALGALEQQSGCPDDAANALGKARIASLCGGECYRPGDRRKAISRIEIARIRPQVHTAEEIAPLIEHRWRVFDCPAAGEGCTVEFDDPDYAGSGRPALYYARVIQEPESLISGDPFGCEYDGEGNCTRRNYCIDENAPREENCRARAEPRAWTSPIFLERPAG